MSSTLPPASRLTGKWNILGFVTMLPRSMLNRVRTSLLIAVTALALLAVPTVASARVFFSSGNLNGSYNRAYKPSLIRFGSHSTITGLRWRNWNRPQPHSYGSVNINNCDPNCALGSTSSYRVSVVLSRVRRCDGVQQYLTMRFHYTGARPADLPSTYRENFGRFCER